MYNKEWESFLFEIINLMQKYKSAAFPNLTNDWKDKMSIIFSISCKDGIVLACDSKVQCSVDNDYVPTGYHCSDEKIWYDNALAAVCCGCLDFINNDGYTGWKDILEESIIESHYYNNHNICNIHLLKDTLVKNLQRYSANNTQMIIADATQRKGILINNLNGFVCDIDNDPRGFIYEFAYTPIKIDCFLNGIFPNIRNYSLEEIKDLAVKYLKLSIYAGDFISDNVSKQESPIGGEIRLLVMHNNGFIENYTVQ